MEWFEYLIIIASISFVILVIFLNFYLKSKGKSLGGGCYSECKGKCGTCNTATCPLTKIDKAIKDYQKSCQS